MQGELSYIYPFISRLWSIKDKKLSLTLAGEEGATPTSVCWVVGEAGQCVVGYNNAVVNIMDAETGQVVKRLDTANDPVSGQVGSELKWN